MYQTGSDCQVLPCPTWWNHANWPAKGPGPGEESNSDWVNLSSAQQNEPIELKFASGKIHRKDVSHNILGLSHSWHGPKAQGSNPFLYTGSGQSHGKKYIFACLDDQMLILVGFVPCDSTKALFFDAETRLNHLKSTFSVGSPPLINQPFFSG